MMACTLANLARLINSFSFLTAAVRGKVWMSAKRSSCSISNSWRFEASCMGRSQKDPMYTRTTSGVPMILPRDHIRAPYTRISCCVEIMSDLLSTMRIFSGFRLISSMTRRNSSEMSSLCASKSRMMRSARSANHSITASKL